MPKRFSEEKAVTFGQRYVVADVEPLTPDQESLVRAELVKQMERMERDIWGAFALPAYSLLAGPRLCEPTARQFERRRPWLGGIINPDQVT